MANIGSPDRIVRIVLGIVLLLAPFVAPSAMATMSGLLPDCEMAMAAAPPSFSCAP